MVEDLHVCKFKREWLKIIIFISLGVTSQHKILLGSCVRHCRWWERRTKVNFCLHCVYSFRGGKGGNVFGMLPRYQSFSIHCVNALQHTLALFPFYKQGYRCSERLNKVIALIFWFPNLSSSCFRKKRIRNTIGSAWTKYYWFSFLPPLFLQGLEENAYASICRLDVTSQVVFLGWLFPSLSP